MAGVAAVTSAPLHAQQSNMPALPVLLVQGSGTVELSNALNRLARNSKDLDALIDAGNAALRLKDADGALGFFARAERLNPRNARVKAGLASALLGTENPYEALRLFDEALRLGMAESFIAADRGLAYDLVGNNAQAQRDYTLALNRGGGDEVKLRYALSLGITGDTDGAARLLNPMLRKNNAAAWRMRAFILAINGDRREARKVARGTMPPRLAASVQPYLDYMPKLTKPQQAAAAHFGHFPKTANIGRQDPRNARYAGVRGGTGADAGLIPAGEPLGANPKGRNAKKKASKKKRRRPGRDRRASWRRSKSESTRSTNQQNRSNRQQTAAVATTVPVPPPGQAIAKPKSLSTAVADVMDKPVTENANTASKPNNDLAKAVAAVKDKPFENKAVQTAQTVKRGNESAGKKPVASGVRVASSANSFDLATTPSSSTNAGYTPSASALDKVKREQSLAAKRPSFETLMSDINVPETELKRDSRAVDLATITPAKPKPKPKPVPAKTAPPQHPARHWVQIAIGQKTSLFPSEWRRLSRKAPEAFEGVGGWMVPVNQTNRLLAGPFEDARTAQAFVNQLAKSDMAALPWKSSAGEEVRKVPKK
ncbi:hypothetical protein [Sphingorhabdus sp. Alg239-R122]|uniref:tetratricopeptide repeat protein n=1 Tax=Sphingorhabdus sp. Alg239-R122 TaxID=2305989 RepID=UPI0013DB3A7F|nr:hypothetical protein [Sphingorhabdus sp. Alg239-R122]